METLLAIIFIVFGILQIILFFKLWGMTNDVRALKNIFESKNQAISEKEPSIGELSLVVLKETGKQMRVKEVLPNNKVRCIAGGVVIGDFNQSEIILFDEWVSENK